MSHTSYKRQINGWILIDKPSGITSTSVVNKVKWALNAKKAGHAGTLDPDATGLLAIALGEATKTIPYITNALKAYDFQIRFGEATNTDDATGEVIATSNLRPSDNQITQTLSSFIGAIEQIPPQFSAVKINGERAYKRARNGTYNDITARPLWVDHLELLSRDDMDHATLRLVCGKGGYVRSVARDLGNALGCYAHVCHLRRIWSSSKHVNDAISFDLIEKLAKKPELETYLYPIEMGLEALPELTCHIEEVNKLRNGNPAVIMNTGSNNEYRYRIW